MTALAADKRREYYGVPTTHYAPNAASQTIYIGALLNLNASGQAVVGTDAASQTFAGVAKKAYASATAATQNVEYETGQVEKFATSSVEAADVGANVFVADDATVTDAAGATNDIKVGKLVRLDGSNAYVHVGVLAATDAA